MLVDAAMQSAALVLHSRKTSLHDRGGSLMLDAWHDHGWR